MYLKRILSFFTMLLVIGMNGFSQDIGMNGFSRDIGTNAFQQAIQQAIQQANNGTSVFPQQQQQQQQGRSREWVRFEDANLKILEIYTVTRVTINREVNPFGSGSGRDRDRDRDRDTISRSIENLNLAFENKTNFEMEVKFNATRRISDSGSESAESRPDITIRINPREKIFYPTGTGTLSSLSPSTPSVGETVLVFTTLDELIHYRINSSSTSTSTSREYEVPW